MRFSPCFTERCLNRTVSELFNADISDRKCFHFILSFFRAMSHFFNHLSAPNSGCLSIFDNSTGVISQTKIPWLNNAMKHRHFYNDVIKTNIVAISRLPTKYTIRMAELKKIIFECWFKQIGRDCVLVCSIFEIFLFKINHLEMFVLFFNPISCKFVRLFSIECHKIITDLCTFHCKSFLILLFFPFYLPKNTNYFEFFVCNFQ